MTAPVRKLLLTTHITSSLGWLGAVVVFLALAIAGLASPEGREVRAAYLAMELITRSVIVPFCVASLVTGIVESLGTPWGLFRHYWVLLKLLLTLVSTVVLLMHTRPIRYAASVAETATSGGALGRLGIQLAADAGMAILVLLVMTVLGVYKPRGMTPYGRRKENGTAAPSRRMAENQAYIE
jgi:hypothetical protein